MSKEIAQTAATAPSKKQPRFFVVSGSQSTQDRAGRMQHCFSSSLALHLQHTLTQYSQVGLPRTCTTSIRAALLELGIGPCHHLLDPMFQFDRIARSAKLLKEEDKEKRQQMLRELFNGYEAGLEMPVSACVDDLVEMYPDAKVRLCVSGVRIRGGMQCCRSP